MYQLLLLSFFCLFPFIDASTILLTDAWSNDNYAASTNLCQEINGGSCGVNRAFTVKQDESVTGDWQENEPYACTAIANTSGPDQWTAQFADGEKNVTRVRVL